MGIAIRKILPSVGIYTDIVCSLLPTGLPLLSFFRLANLVDFRTLTFIVLKLNYESALGF